MDDLLSNSPLFIRRISLKADIDPKEFESFPLNIPALRNFVSLRFTKNVTMFNGENGCGKSTLIEAIADNLNIPVTGGNSNLSSVMNTYDYGEEKGSELSQYLLCDKGFRKPYRTFFFRAESFYKLADILSHDRWINHSNYADKDLLEQSHGESFMDFMKHQLTENSLFILDEPEAALSPQNQLKLLVLINDLSKEGSQFIIATHSPFILGYRGAEIINLDDGIKRIKFKNTKIYSLFKRYLDNPEMYQVALFDDD